MVKPVKAVSPYISWQFKLKKYPFSLMKYVLFYYLIGIIAYLNLRIIMAHKRLLFAGIIALCLY